MKLGHAMFLAGSLALAVSGCATNEPQVGEAPQPVLQRSGLLRCGTPELTDDQKLAIDRIRAARAAMKPGNGNGGGGGGGGGGGDGGGECAGGTVKVQIIKVMDDDGDQGSQFDAAEQFTVLKNAFAAHQITLVEAGPPIEVMNSEFFNNCSSSAGEDAMKEALRPADPDVVPIYSCDAGDYLGWAYFGTGAYGEFWDGVVVHYRSCGDASFEFTDDVGELYNYHECDTATHELGHALDLYHSFEGGCGGPGDRVSDTPYHSVNYSCDEFANTCGAMKKNDQKDPIHNYMNYTDDVCITEFTTGQCQRMVGAPYVK